MPVQAAILAGGKGTRMRSVSDTPKVLLPLGDKPILVRQLEWLKAASGPISGRCQCVCRPRMEFCVPFVEGAIGNDYHLRCGNCPGNRGEGRIA